METLREILKKAIFELYQIDFEPEITEAPENIDADFSSNAPLKLAKEVHKSPMNVCGELIETVFSSSGLEFSSTSYTGQPREPSLRDEPLGGVRNIRVENSNLEMIQKKQFSISFSQPGFLNFKLSGKYLKEKIEDVANRGVKGSKKFQGKTVVCEFSDPNPFKVLHVGHLYTSVVGDAISRLFEYAGAKVIRANFGGDVGLHVAKTMFVLRQKDLEDLTIEDIARCYVEGTAIYEDDENARAEITELNKEIYKINAENIHEGETAELYWRGRELSYEYFKDFYARIGVKFDKFYPESTVAELGLTTVLRELDNGVYEKSDGAVVFDGEKYGLHTRVFVNREGVPTYEAKDAGLIFAKWEDWHFDKSVVITGSEQLEYMKVVLKSVEQYAPELVEKTAHLTHGLVKLPGNVKMSSRKGNFLKAVDVLSMVEEELKQEYESEDTKVSLAAVKYAFLKYKMGGNIVFDPKESVKMTGNSGPYLLYSAVRAKKILSKAGEKSKLDDKKYDVHERALAKKLICYKNVLVEAVEEMAPHKVATYLYEVAQEFSRFYENCPVVGTEEEAKRVELVKAYSETMEHGLKILGIEIPEEM